MSLHEDVLDYFQSNWISANTGGVTPNFYYVRNFKEYKLDENRIIAYDRSGERERPSGLGYSTVNLENTFGLDIYTHTSQSLADLFHTETLRILRLIRKGSLNMDLIIVDNKGIPRSVPGYAVFGWVIECTGKKYGQAI